MGTVTKKLTKQFTRDNTKELLVLRNKLIVCLSKFVNEKGYIMHTSVSGSSDLNKTLTINLIKKESDNAASVIPTDN